MAELRMLRLEQGARMHRASRIMTIEQGSLVAFKLKQQRFKVAAEEPVCRCLKAGQEHVHDRRMVFEGNRKVNPLLQDGQWSPGQQAFRSKSAGVSAAILVGLSILQSCEEAMAGLVPVAFPWEKKEVEQVEPSRGTCATCIGVVDETLGTCNATGNCVSSFDDRPKFFVAPWEFPGKLPVALEELRGALVKAGAKIEEQEERYVHAIFTSKEGIMDDVEFLFSNPDEDRTVVLRSASRAIKVDDKQRNRNRLEEIRKSLAWEKVPVLRNRKRTLFFLESPWDSFGPEPPPSVDYKNF